jgi:hypothetical protein
MTPHLEALTLKAYRSLQPIPVVMASIAMLVISVACLTAYRSFQSRSDNAVTIWDQDGNRVQPSPYKDTDTTMHVYDNQTKQMIEIERQSDGTWQPK